MSKGTQTKSTAYYVNAVICILIMLLFGMIPAPDPMTPLGMKVIGIFLGMIYGWITVGTHWPSLLGILLLGLSGYASVNDVLKDTFGNNTVLMLFFICIMTGVLNSAGLTRYFCMKVLNIKWAKGHPWRMTFLVIMSNYVCSAFLAPAASLLLIWSVLYSLFEMCDYKPGEKWPMLMIAGTAFSGNIAGQMFPFKNLCVSVLGQFENILGETVNSAGFILWMLVFSLVSTVLFFLLVKFVFKPDVSKLINAKLDEKIPPLTGYQKFVLGVFVAYVIALLLPDLLPKSWALTAFLRSLGNTGIALAAVIIILLAKFQESVPVGKMIFEGVNWNMIFLIASAMMVASAFRSEATGIEPFIVKYVTPVLEGKSGLGLVIICILIVTIMTQFCNNAATVTVITPVFLVVISGLGDIGVNLKVIMLMTIAAGAMATLAPSGGTHAALLHGNRTWIPKASDLYLLCAIMVVINLLVMFVIGIPLASIIPL